MRLLLIMLLALPYTSFARCELTDGKTSKILENGATTSLFEPKRSLSTHQTQDQDGLGTCYANAASVLLKSALKKNPDISYIHAAMQANFHKKKFFENSKSFTWGGGVCDTVTAVSVLGGACPKSSSILESMKGLAPETQEVIFRSLGSYFDFFNGMPKDEKSRQELLARLDLSLKGIKEAISKRRYQCGENKLEPLPMRPALERMLRNQFLFMAPQSACREEKKKLLQKHLEEDSFIKSDRVRIRVLNSLYQEFKTYVSNDPELVKLFLAHVNFQDLDEKALNKKLNHRINRFFLKKFPQTQFGGKCKSEKYDNTELSFMFSAGDHTGPVSPVPAAGAPVKDKGPEMVEDPLADDFLYSTRNTLSEPCVKDVVQHLIDHPLELTCGDENSPLRVYATSIPPLLKIGQKLGAQSLKENLLQSRTDSLAQLMGFLAPTCQDKNNLLKMDDLVCDNTESCSERLVDKKLETSCKPLAETAKNFRAQVLSDLTSDRAVGISVCTSFLVDPGFKTENCQKLTATVPNHSYHAMAVTGYRCREGKIEYEVLNSWGKNYCPNDTKTFDCVRDKDKQLTGRFWVPEEILADSLSTYHSIRNREK